MGLWEVSLRASYDYPFIELSRAVPQTPISMWCLWDRELLQIPHRSPRVVGRVEKGIHQAGRVIDQWVDAHSSRLFLLKCTCDRYRSPWNLMNAHRCWDEPPIVFQDGWASFRAISFETDGPRALYDDLRSLGRAELVLKRELPLDVLPSSVRTNVLFGGLTAKQAHALVTAHRFGYYASPRPVKTEEIATSLGIGRTTYEEHLRKAENRVITTLIPYLELFSAANRPQERSPLKQTHSGLPPTPKDAGKVPGDRVLRLSARSTADRMVPRRPGDDQPHQKTGIGRLSPERLRHARSEPSGH
jgi:predicted DNA binding protein